VQRDLQPTNETHKYSKRDLQTYKRDLQRFQKRPTERRNCARIWLQAKPSVQRDLQKRPTKDSKRDLQKMQLRAHLVIGETIRRYFRKPHGRSNPQRPLPLPQLVGRTHEPVKGLACDLPVHRRVVFEHLYHIIYIYIYVRIYKQMTCAYSKTTRVRSPCAPPRCDQKKKTFNAST